MKIHYFKSNKKRTTTTFNQVEINLLKLYYVRANLELMDFQNLVSNDLHSHAVEGAISPKNALLLKAVNYLA